MHTHALTHTDTYLCGEGTFSQNIWDYFPEGLTLRKKLCSILFHKSYVVL